MKNKTILSLMVLLLVVVSAASVFAARRGPLISADILKYEPAPVEPGGYAEVWVSVNNEGTTSEDFRIEFFPEYPFSLAEGEDELKTLKALPEGENAVVKYRLVVAHDAPNKDMPVKFQYQFGESLVWTRLEGDISIRTAGAILTVDEYSTIPEAIQPGDFIKVDIDLGNHGKITVKDVDVTLELDESVIAPIGSGNTKRIKEILPGETQKVSFSLIADTSAEIKVYSIPLKLNYKDIRNTEYDDETRISLIMSAEPDLMVVVDSTEVTAPNKPGIVTLKIINKGIMDLKYLNTRLVSTEQYEVLSPSNEEYIGNLDSDDFETFEFIIKPKVKDVRLNVIVDFKDPYNKDYSKTFDLPLRIVSKAELGEAKSYTGTIIIVLLVLAVIIYWLYRRRKKKKKNKK
ncbi:hypothetical protein KY338_03695 [Candidatus Woesearchaeota archaeon]|nr:hypothetical protein [Candidatus Woesearchaeota archaeon]MBW3005415.1 hypothetical protein [Candidatus Woesearchaeota archaeon]